MSALGRAGKKKGENKAPDLQNPAAGVLPQEINQPGFDPDTLPDCCDPENLLKSSGRGIFMIRSFMDELVLRRAAEGGMEVMMVKRAHQPQQV
jgi:hypothetical protein